ncbi:hypothetical protein CWI37_2567p0010 [Hamiltosporidium tvaerminnensis]|uniref:Uncharacterized protein n=1 Tax=Hamiltosporidium tvaerminnensis TaxID=1176355 RepID=A0A4Q9KQT3_9MICR|nr:hypothetical protein CWI37_2567p0010 [Hamiltosporidium tvaerminnensis]
MEICSFKRESDYSGSFNLQNQDKNAMEFCSFKRESDYSGSFNLQNQDKNSMEICSFKRESDYSGSFKLQNQDKNAVEFCSFKRESDYSGSFKLHNQDKNSMEICSFKRESDGLKEEKFYFIRELQLFQFYKKNIIELENHKNKTETIVAPKTILCLPYTKNIFLEEQQTVFLTTKSLIQTELNDNYSSSAFQENIPSKSIRQCNSSNSFEGIESFKNASNFDSIETHISIEPHIPIELHIPIRNEPFLNQKPEKTFKSEKSITEDNLNPISESKKINSNLHPNSDKTKIKELNIQPTKKPKLIISHNDGYFEHSSDIILSQLELYDEEELFLFDQKL